MNPQAIYQDYIKKEFKRRRSRGVSYSLRAFARDLQVPPAKLSQYLSGSCGISKKRASEMGKKLKLKPIDLELFVCAAEAAHARDSFSRQVAQEKLKALISETFTTMDLERFDIIKEWYHFALLELTEVEGFQSSVGWISKVLKISEDDAQAAVERLVKCGLLDTLNVPWKQVLADVQTTQDLNSLAIQEYHRQMLKIAGNRISEVDVSKRELNAMVFPLDPKLMPELKALVHKFQDEVGKLVRMSEHKTSLYSLNSQLVPIYFEEVTP